jgi:translation initiation factor IF-2
MHGPDKGRKFLAIRVFELAKELDVTSKQILDKCRAEGMDLKNHMATLKAGQVATIRDWFSEAASTTSVETAEHVNLGEAREVARKQRRRRTKELPEQPVEAEEPAAEPPPQVEEATPEAPSEPVEPQPQPLPEPEPQPEPVVVVAEPPEPEPQAPPPPPAEPEPQQAAAQVQPPPPEPPKTKPPVRPVGPQLVPKPAQLKGPRVVRVERPDFVDRPRAPRPGPRPPRPGAPGMAPPAPPTGTVRRPTRKPVVVDEEEDAKGGAAAKQRRSPRRRGGRSADSGTDSTLQAWRDRDLAERSERLAAATTGSGLRRHRASVSTKPSEASGPSVRAGVVEVEEPITVKSLAAATGLKGTMLIRKLMELGVMVTLNQAIDRETAQTVVAEYGVELSVAKPKTAEELLAENLAKRPAGELVTRAPVVTFLGHVDHGKTSLLDRIRNATVASGEAGGITQHIGAYRYDIGDKHVVFLDTPGHEAFTAMRARGANMTDVVVLVVAADDGVMPQTVEALSHAKAANVPIVVALNKIDIPGANIQRVLGQLAEHGLQPREWGGSVEVIRTSATTGEGIDSLVETLSLEAELLELKAEVDAPGSGYVIEAKMDSGLGVLARLLVRNGTLKVGDVLLAGRGYGRVRQMLDSHGRQIDQAPPATPVEVSGLDEMPEAGDRFYVTDGIEQAREVADDRRERARTQALAAPPPRTLDELAKRIEAGESNELAVIIKTDVQGSAEALTGSLRKLVTEEVRLKVLHCAVGGISTGDVMLAEASSALIIGFNVVPDAAARTMAESKGIDIRLYRIIYDVIEDIRKALEEGLAPEVRQEVSGHAEVRQTFKVSRVGTIAGCYVTDGVAQRSAKVRITRNNVVIEDNRTLESLKRFKDDAREVRAGLECGLKIAGYDDVKEGDVLEFYQVKEVARTL